MSGVVAGTHRCSSYNIDNYWNALLRNSGNRPLWKTLLSHSNDLGSDYRNGGLGYHWCKRDLRDFRLHFH